MRKEDKKVLIDSISQQLEEANNFYLTNISALNAEDTSDLRRLSFKNGIKLVVVKNTLLKKAMENVDKDLSELHSTLVGNTAIMFSEAGNAPAKMIKEFRKNSDKPIIKGAYIEETVYLGDDQLEFLVSIKSKDELIADIVALLQSPVKNVVSSLQSGGSTLTGILKTLSEREGQESLFKKYITQYQLDNVVSLLNGKLEYASTYDNTGKITKKIIITYDETN